MMKKISKYTRLLLIFILILAVKEVSLPNNITKTSNSNLNKTLDLHAMATKIEEIEKNDLYTALDVYNGTLTGYTANCPLCGGTLGCTGQNVKDGTTTYNDKQYGNVRIVASSSSLPCGSIVQFELNSLSSDSITAIVLGRGVTGTALDLLVKEESEALKSIGRKTISYKILRFGYTR